MFLITSGEKKEQFHFTDKQAKRSSKLKSYYQNVILDNEIVHPYLHQTVTRYLLIQQRSTSL